MDRHNDDIYLLKNEIAELRKEVSSLRQEMRQLFHRHNRKTFGEKLKGNTFIG